MKKFLYLFFSLMMLVGLCGCASGNETDDVRGSIIGGDKTQDEKEPELSLGVAENGTYRNEFLGVSFTAPAGWEFYTDEQIMELNNVVGEYIDEDVVEQLKNATIVYDMYATYQEEGSNVNVNLEKLSAAQSFAIDIKQALEAQIDVIKTTYANMGYTDINASHTKVRVDGKEFDGLRVTAKIQDIDFYVTAFAFKKSNYLANITVCSLQTDRTNAILSCFTVQ